MLCLSPFRIVPYFFFFHSRPEKRSFAPSIHKNCLNDSLDVATGTHLQPISTSLLYFPLRTRVVVPSAHVAPCLQFAAGTVARSAKRAQQPKPPTPPPPPTATKKKKKTVQRNSAKSRNDTSLQILLLQAASDVLSQCFLFFFYIFLFLHQRSSTSIWKCAAPPLQSQQSASLLR